jgi:hypothetical protein
MARHLQGRSVVGLALTRAVNCEETKEDEVTTKKFLKNQHAKKDEMPITEGTKGDKEVPAKGKKRKKHDTATASTDIRGFFATRAIPMDAGSATGLTGSPGVDFETEFEAEILKKLGQSDDASNAKT